MDRKAAYERLLKEGFTAQQRENLARLGKDYARRELLDLPVEDRSSNWSVPSRPQRFLPLNPW